MADKQVDCLPVITWPTRAEIKTMPAPLATGWFWTVVTHSWAEDERLRLHRAMTAAML